MRVWIFADWNPISVHEMTMLRYLRATDVVLGIMGVNGTPSAFNNLQFSLNTDALKKQGIRVHHMYWLVRNCKRVKEAIELIKGHEKKSKPDSILFDAEGSWHVTDDVSFTPYIAKEYIKEELANVDTKIGLTGISPKIHNSLKPLVSITQYLLPQAYSIWHPSSGTHWSRSTVTEPGIMQHEAYQEWKLLLGGKARKLIMGLAGYWCERPGITQLESMRRCLSAVRTEGVEDVAYWSLKHLMHKLPNDVSTDSAERSLFIRNINEPHLENYTVTPLHTPGVITHKLPAFIQWLLIKNGKEIKLDGIWGPKSQKALVEFRNTKGIKIPEDVLYTQEDLDALVQPYINIGHDES